MSVNVETGSMGLQFHELTEDRPVILKRAGRVILGRVITAPKFVPVHGSKEQEIKTAALIRPDRDPETGVQGPTSVVCESELEDGKVSVENPEMPSLAPQGDFNDL